MTAVLELADAFTSHAAILYLQFIGADVDGAMREATRWLADNLPLREGIEREDSRRRFRGEPGLSHGEG